MMNERDGGPAFPRGHANSTSQEGMSLRDWFAGMALPRALRAWGFASGEKAAESAYRIADAMLIERDKAR